MSVREAGRPTIQASKHAEPTPSAGHGDARRIVLGLLLAIASGGLATLAFPPFEWWPLILVAFVPMVVAQHRVMPARWSGLAIGVGYGTYFAGQITPGLSFAGAHVPIAFQLLPLYVTIFVTLLARGSRAFHERTGYRWLVLSMPLAWTGIDALRGLASETFGGTFANPVYALYHHPALLQPVSVFGIWGLELLVLVINWAVATAVIGAIDRSRASQGAPRVTLRAARRGLSIAGALALVWVVASVAMLQRQAGTVRVAAVQTGLSAKTPAERAEKLQRDIAQTRLAAKKGARLVVWNEGGLRFDPQERHTQELRDLAAETDTYLVLGYSLTTNGLRRNEVTVLTPGGRFLGVYGKDHPGRFAGDQSDTGGHFPVYKTALGTIASIVCYDLDFTDTARKVSRRGGQIIATPSSDVSTLAETHYTHLVFRAIENRVSAVKADSKWDSAIIDPYGRIVAVTTNPDGAQRTLVADVPLGSRDSVYVTLGDWFGWLCAAGMLGFLVLAWRTRRAAPRDLEGGPTSRPA